MTFALMHSVAQSYWQQWWATILRGGGNPLHCGSSKRCTAPLSAPQISHSCKMMRPSCTFSFRLQHCKHLVSCLFFFFLITHHCVNSTKWWKLVNRKPPKSSTWSARSPPCHITTVRADGTWRPTEKVKMMKRCQWHTTHSHGHELRVWFKQILCC